MMAVCHYYLHVASCRSFGHRGSQLRRLSFCAGKRKKLGFCKAFADVHAANERLHNLFVDLSAASC